MTSARSKRKTGLAGVKVRASLTQPDRIFTAFQENAPSISHQNRALAARWIKVCYAGLCELSLRLVQWLVALVRSQSH